MTANALPMSRTKWTFSGPVSGTAAGSPTYQPAGSASIQAALARFASPNTPRHQNQKPDGSALRMGPPCGMARGGGALGRPARGAVDGAPHARPVVAQHATQAGDALADRVRLERRERECDVVAASVGGEEHLATRVRH